MHNNTKAIFFDIDGTLVSYKTHRVPESAIEAIRRVRRSGVKIFIATGRPLPFINNLGELEYDGIVSVNGGCCTTAEGTLISKQTIPQEDIDRLIDDAAAHPMTIVFVNNDTALRINTWAATPIYQETFKMLNIELPREVAPEAIRGMDVMQAIAFFTADDEQRIMNELIPGCDIARWHPAFADCIRRGTSKAYGIDQICRHYDIDISDTMAFGDGGNDIEMLRHAGIGIAMGNAPDDVKAEADMITAHVDEDGIAKILDTISA